MNYYKHKRRIASSSHPSLTRNNPLPLLSYLIILQEYVVVGGVIASPFGSNHMVANMYYNVHRLLHYLRFPISSAPLIRANEVSECIMCCGRVVQCSVVWCGVVAIGEIRVPPSFSVCYSVCLSLMAVCFCLSVCLLDYICNILVCLFEWMSEAAYAEHSLPRNLPTGTREDDIPRWVVLLKKRGGEMKKGVKRGEKKR